MSVTFNEDYPERVYAGVLGKVIGVYLGRPFEGWTYETIQEKLGDIENYVHDKVGHPLIVTDDDISGTFTFARALADNGYRTDLTAKEIGDTWLNYLIENRTILWWGGMGNSTEHTAYLRLKNGIEAPDSGSMALNGQVVAEQIGAQIFIDGWAMVSPGDADQAARLAEAAARVSHDGEAVNGAVVLAVMEAMAFVENDIDTLIDTALGHIPANSLIRRLIDDVRTWAQQEPDWRATREKLAATYGYDKYGGNCHMVPNHGLIIHSLVHGQDDFSETMKIINTCGWDTDCNSGNVGCLMGIKNGISGIDHSDILPVDWRGPVADRIYVPTADPSWGISDCGREAVALVDTAYRMQGREGYAPKSGAHFHFEFAGAVQGFRVDNDEGGVRAVDGKLAVELGPGQSVTSPVFTPSKDVAKHFEKAGYALLASPRLYPGQKVRAQVRSSGGTMQLALLLKYYGEGDVAVEYRGDGTAVSEAGVELTMVVPAEAHPCFEIGLVSETGGNVEIDYLTWEGVPEVVFDRPAKGSMWRRAWVDGTDTFWSFAETYRVIHNQGRGMIMQGTRDWTDYAVEADVTPHLATSAGLAARVQGMRRYYALLLENPGRLKLVCMRNSETVLASCDFDWTLGQTYQLKLGLSGNKIQAFVDGTRYFECEDETLTCGGVGLLVEEGRTATERVKVGRVA